MGKYIVIKDFKTPIVFDTRNPRNPTQVKYKMYKRGETIDGSLKLDAAGKPEFILSSRKLVIPIAAVKELVAREVTSSANGTKDAVTVDEKGNKSMSKQDAKIKYIDTALVFGLVGFGIVWVAQKYGKLQESPENKIPHQNKLVGFGLGAAIGAYYTFRKASKEKITIKK